MSLLGVKITIVSTSIPIVLIGMGIADGIHIIHEYYHHLRKGSANLEIGAQDDGRNERAGHHDVGDHGVRLFCAGHGRHRADP